MIKTIEFEFKPSAEEMVNGLWEMDCGQQADFLSELSRLYKFNKVDFLKQLQFVSDEINCEDDAYNKASIVRLLEEVLDYVKGEGEAK